MRYQLFILTAVAAALFCSPPPGTHLVPVIPVRLSPADSTVFAANLEKARSLAVYARNIGAASDSVRGQVNDAVRSRLGSEWFCLPGKNGAVSTVFGKYDTLRGTYDAVFHYTVDTAGTVVRQRQLPPLGVTLPRARAVNRALVLAKPLVQQGQVRLNPYVDRMPDGTLEVFLLPGPDPDGTLTYGCECRYIFDGTGSTLLDSTVRSGRVRGIQPLPGRRVSLVNRTGEVPSVGQLFFVLTYHARFDDIRIENRATLTHYHKGGDGIRRFTHSAKLVVD